jgi:hypothetical protein
MTYLMFAGSKPSFRIPSSGMLLIGAFQRVDQDEPLVRRHQPGPDISDPDVVQVVENLERRDVL